MLHCSGIRPQILTATEKMVGFFGSSSNQPVPVVNHAAGDPLATPAIPPEPHGTIDGIIPGSGTPMPPAPSPSPSPVIPVQDDPVGDYIMTDTPAPTPDEPPAEPSDTPTEPETPPFIPETPDESTTPEPESEQIAEPAYPGFDESTPYETAESTPEAPAELIQPEPEPKEEVAPEEPQDPTTPEVPSTTSTTPAMSSDLAALKQQALQQLSPIFNHLDQTPEERFNTTMMMLQATDDESLLTKAYESAQEITDDKIKAQALLDIINEINYFSSKNN